MDLYIWIYQPFYLSTSIHLSTVHVSMCPCVHPSIHPAIIHLCICLFVHPLIFLCLYLSISLSVYASIWPSYLLICLFVCLSIFLSHFWFYITGCNAILYTRHLYDQSLLSPIWSLHFILTLHDPLCDSFQSSCVHFGNSYPRLNVPSIIVRLLCNVTSCYPIYTICFNMLAMLKWWVEPLRFQWLPSANQSKCWISPPLAMFISQFSHSRKGQTKRPNETKTHWIPKTVSTVFPPDSHGYHGFPTVFPWFSSNSGTWIPPWQTQVLLAADSCGLRRALRNLASRPEIVAWKRWRQNVWSSFGYRMMI